MTGTTYDPRRDPRIMHFIEADYGKHGLAFIETDPAKADFETILNDILEVDRPTRVIRVFLEEASSKDVSEEVANEIVLNAYHNGHELSEGVIAFCEDHKVDVPRCCQPGYEPPARPDWMNNRGQAGRTL